MLKSFIKANIKRSNFQGVAVCVGNKSIVHWWDPEEKKVNELLIEIKIDEAISFQCVEGELQFFDF